jgi:hypothetical protein
VRRLGISIASACNLMLDCFPIFIIKLFNRNAERNPFGTAPQDVQEGRTTHPRHLLPQYQKRRILIQPQGRRQRLRERTRQHPQRGTPTPTQANAVIQKYKDAADSASKNSDLEAQIRKVQESLEKEKEKSYQEFEKYKRSVEEREGKQASETGRKLR